MALAVHRNASNNGLIVTAGTEHASSSTDTFGFGYGRTMALMVRYDTRVRIHASYGCTINIGYDEATVTGAGFFDGGVSLKAEADCSVGAYIDIIPEDWRLLTSGKKRLVFDHTCGIIPLCSEPPTPSSPPPALPAPRTPPPAPSPVPSPPPYALPAFRTKTRCTFTHCYTYSWRLQVSTGHRFAAIRTQYFTTGVAIWRDPIFRIDRACLYGDTGRCVVWHDFLFRLLLPQKCSRCGRNNIQTHFQRRWPRRVCAAREDCAGRDVVCSPWSVGQRERLWKGRNAGESQGQARKWRA